MMSLSTTDRRRLRVRQVIWIEQDASTDGFLRGSFPVVCERLGLSVSLYVNVDRQFEPQLSDTTTVFRVPLRRFWDYIKFPFRRVGHSQAALVLTESPTFSGLAAILLARKIKVKSVLRLGIFPLALHDARRRSAAKRGGVSRILLMGLLKLTYRLFDLIIVDNREIEAHIRRLAPNASVVICPPFGLDEALFSKIESRKMDRPIVGMYAGRFCVEKDGLSLLFKLLPYMRDAGVRIDLYGDGPLRSHYEILCRDYSDVVCFKGHVARDVVLEAMATADFYIHPALTEGHGMAVLEAMAAGCLVVAPRVGGLREFVSTETAIVISDPNSAGSYQAALDEVMAMSQDDAMDKRSKASLVAHSLLDQAQISDRLTSLIRECLAP